MPMIKRVLASVALLARVMRGGPEDNEMAIFREFAALRAMQPPSRLATISRMAEFYIVEM